MGFFSFETAWRTLQGYEIMNMIRKGQVQGVDKGDIVRQMAWVRNKIGTRRYCLFSHGGEYTISFCYFNVYL